MAFAEIFLLWSFVGVRRPQINMVSDGMPSLLVKVNTNVPAHFEGVRMNG